jgi:hypothetical protein
MSHTAVTFYALLREKFAKTSPRNLETKQLTVASQQCTILHFLLHQEIFFFTKNNMTVVPKPPYFYLFPRLKIKLKGRHFDTTDVMEAESQAVLNTLTEHDFQDALRKVAEAPGTLHTSGRELLHWLMLASRPKVGF